MQPPSEYSTRVTRSSDICSKNKTRFIEKVYVDQLFDKFFFVCQSNYSTLNYLTNTKQRSNEFAKRVQMKFSRTSDMHAAILDSPQTRHSSILRISS